MDSLPLLDCFYSERNKMKKTISIIGGGPSSLLLAAFIDLKKFKVTIFEKNKTAGRKFLVAGKGGFNLTYSEPILDFIKHYTPSSLLKKPLLNFTNTDFRDWLKSIGIPTFIGSSKRVYPEKGIKPITVLNTILDHLKEKMRQGYSLIVFPEGKRMYSNKIGRFHKGAFFLAEELKLDVLPLYIHGNSEVLPKGDFIIYDGAITVKLGNRIAMGDPTLGESIKDKTKSISKIFKNDFQSFREAVEAPKYFEKLVLSNFIYKSKNIYNTVQLDIDSNLKLYSKLSKLISLEAKLLHIADDYGQLDLLLNYYSNRRKITTFISNEIKYKVAKNNFIGKERKVTYLNTLENYSFSKVVLISTAIQISDLDITQVDKVIILNNCMNVSLFTELSFIVDLKDVDVVVLTRKNK